MELRDFAERILRAGDAETKLAPLGPDATDRRPGPPLRVHEPARVDPIRFADRRQSAQMPKADVLREPHLKAIAHHIMANHELQALEIMAWVLCAFPDAPSDFRTGLATIMADEQRHTRMHLRCLDRLGVEFGDLPLNGHVWIRCRESADLLDYLAALPLTFEGGNLDHTLDFSARFSRGGDTRASHVMLAIHDDEIDHVAFGLRWLRTLKPADLSDWQTYLRHLRWPLTPFRAKGQSFHPEPRRRACLDDEFIAGLAGAQRPSELKSS